MDYQLKVCNNIPIIIINLCIKIAFFIFLFADLISSSPDIETKKLQAAIAQLVLLRMDYTELACLKTIVLFRPGILHTYVH